MRLMRRFAALAIVGSTTLLVLAPSASAAVDDCVTVKGKNGMTSNGYARVCLKDFFYTESADSVAVTSTAKLGVSQYRRSAPNHVYVKWGWVVEFAYNTWVGRLGPNENKDAKYTRTKSKSSGDYMSGVQVRLCYAKLFTDSCFAKKILWQG